MPREEEQVEREHQAQLRRTLERKKVQLEDHLAQQVDPSTAVTTVYNLEFVNLQLELPSIKADLAPDNYLTILNRTEDWYTSRGYKYPQPERLKEQRRHWELRKTQGHS